MSNQSGSSSPLEAYLDDIVEWVERGLTHAQIVQELRLKGVTTSEGSVRRAKARAARKLGRDIRSPRPTPASDTDPSFKIEGDEAEINTGRAPYDDIEGIIPTPDELMALHGLDPEDWVYNTPIVNWWGHPGNRFYQLKLKLQRKVLLSVVMPARIDGVYIAPKRVVDRRKVKTILIYGDQQAPFVDWDTFEGMLSLTKEFQPSMIIDPGDGRDFPSVSHHRTWPEWMASAQKCIDTKYLLDREMRKANESAEMVQFLGNHDIRLASYMMEKAPAAYGLTPGCADDEVRMMEAYSIRNLGRLDELGIELVSNEKEAYDQARFMLGDRLGVEHGNKTGKDPALKAQHRRTFGIVMGHTHGQSINHVVDYDHNGEAIVHLAIETGTGAVRDRGIGFSPNPNWVGGGVWISLHEDGMHHAELITSRGGQLYFRDKRY